MATPARRRFGQTAVALAIVTALHAPADLAAQPTAGTAASAAGAPGDSIERLTLGRAEVAVAARRGLGIVVLVRGRYAPTVVTLRPDEAAVWSARTARWLDSTRNDDVDESHPLRSESSSAPGGRLFVERGVAGGRHTIALCAADSAGKRGTVLEMTEPELKDVLTSVWGVSSEADSSLMSREILDGDSVWVERTATRWATPRPTKRIARYPRNLLEKRVEGGVVLTIVVDTGGAPILPTVEVLDATHAEFTRSVLDFLRHASFEPAEVSGRKVKARCILTFTFGIAPPRQPSAFDVLRIADRDPRLRPSP